MIGLKYLYAMLSGAFSGQPTLNLRGRRPTGSQLRNPADPVQARRIEAAAAKRARRAEKLKRDLHFSFGQNNAHWSGTDRAIGNMPKRFYPFYVAK